MKSIHQLLLIMIAMTLTRSADAQFVGQLPGGFRTGVRYVGAPYTYVSPWGYYNWGNWGGAVSSQGDAMRGYAEMIRARSQAAEARARAMINYEQARKKYLENQAQLVRTYIERREYGEAKRAERYAAKRALRDRYRESQSAATPDRLSPSELSPSTGKIFWPLALQADDFAETREQMEELFLTRAHTGTTNNLVERVQMLARDMKDILNEKIRELSAPQYLAARRFIDGLSYEASL